MSNSFALTISVYPMCVNQISDSDSEVDYLTVTPEVTDVVPDTVPVTGESYCHCDAQEETSPGTLLQGFQPLNDCLCGEEDQGV